MINTFEFKCRTVVNCLLLDSNVSWDVTKFKVVCSFFYLCKVGLKTCSRCRKGDRFKKISVSIATHGRNKTNTLLNSICFQVYFIDTWHNSLNYIIQNKIYFLHKHVQLVKIIEIFFFFMKKVYAHFSGDIEKTQFCKTSY